MDPVDFQCSRNLVSWRRIPKERRSAKRRSIVHTKVLVDSGIYSVVRHPQYLGFILFVLALVLMSQHWLSVISGMLGSALFYKDILREEQMSVMKFGDDYKRYMKMVPRGRKQSKLCTPERG